MSVYITFTWGGTWFSRLIMWAIRSKVAVSHSMFLMDIDLLPPTGLLRSMSVGAEGEGVRWIPANTFFKKNKVRAVFSIDIEAPTLAKSLVWMEETYSEAPYDFSGATAIGVRNRLRSIWAFLGRWWRSRLSQNAVICTELVLRTLQHMGLLYNLDPELTDPITLMHAINGRKDNFSLIYATEDVAKILGEQAATSNS